MTLTPEHPTSWGRVSQDAHRTLDAATVLQAIATGARADHLATIIDDARHICAVLEDRWQAMCDALPGQPGASDPTAEKVSGSSRGDGRDPSKPSAADRDIAAVREGCARARHLIVGAFPSDEEVRHCRDALFRVRTRLGNYFARSATPSQKRATAHGDDGCASCARLAGNAGKRWEPVHKAGLCRWCYDWFRDYGGHPPERTLQDHHDGKRIKRPEVPKVVAEVTVLSAETVAKGPPNTTGTGGAFHWRDRSA